MFDFRIIEIEDGRQIIDMRIKTPYGSNETKNPERRRAETENCKESVIQDSLSGLI